jgi:TPR repeat protein
LKRQEERAEAAVRELATVGKELATLRAARQRESMSAASEIANLQQALVRERERGDDVAREWAARVDEMRALQETTVRQEVKADRWVFSLEGIAMAGAADDSAGQLRQSVVTTGAIAAPADGGAAASADKSATARATPPPLPTDDRLIARAEALFRSGDVSGARLLLERAQEDGNAQATFLLAETFDPNALSTIGAVGIRSDPERARELYRRALTLGVVRATARMEALK